MESVSSKHSTKRHHDHVTTVINMAEAFTVHTRRPARGVYRSIVRSRPIDLDTNIHTTEEPGGPGVKKIASVHHASGSRQDALRIFPSFTTNSGGYG